MLIITKIFIDEDVYMKINALVFELILVSTVKILQIILDYFLNSKLKKLDNNYV